MSAVLHSAPEARRPDHASHELAAARRALLAPARRDLWLVLGLTLLTFVLACRFELHETVNAWTQRFEAWQLDEVPSALTALALGLAWMAWRRRRDTARELARRMVAEQHAWQLLEHNRELARQLIAVQESERRALARELHDELGQRCTAIRLEAECLLHTQDLREVHAAAQRTAASAEALHLNVRLLLRRLRPAELDELGLVGAVQALCEAWEERSGVACIFHHDGALEGLGESLDTAAYRLVQEALSNVMRHARASRVRIRLVHAVPGGELLLRVEDDGCGFDPERATRGLGLVGAAERAAAHGGELQVRSTPGRGTTLHARLPVCAP